jgi:hypothetical protein
MDDLRVDEVGVRVLEAKLPAPRPSPHLRRPRRHQEALSAQAQHDGMNSCAPPDASGLGSGPRSDAARTSTWSRDDVCDIPPLSKDG